MTELSEISNAREEMILDHVPQIKYIAQRIFAKLPSHVDFEDLVSAGILGLLDAIEKFNPDRGVKLKTYAEIRIRGAIMDSLRGLDWASRSLRKHGKDLGKVSKDLLIRLGRPPTDEEICLEMGLSLDGFHELTDQIQGLGPYSLDELVYGEDDRGNGRPNNNGRTLTDNIIDYSLPDPLSLCENRETNVILADAIDGLPDKQRLVVSLYYYDELTMKEIGQVLGVNESCVSQLHTKAVIRLRRAFRNFSKPHPQPIAKAHRVIRKDHRPLSPVEMMIVRLQNELSKDHSDLAILKGALAVLVKLSNSDPGQR